MTTLSFTIPTAGSTPFSTAAANVDSALQAIETWAGGNIDGGNVAATLTGRRLVGQACAQLSGVLPAQTFTITQIAGGLAAGGSGPVNWWYLDPANFAVTGKANTQLILRMSLATNTVATTQTFAAQLVAVTFAGGSGLLVPTVGAVQGSCSIASPAASSALVAESTAFAFPAAGAYAPAIAVSGSGVSGFSSVINLQLFAVNS